MANLLSHVRRRALDLAQVRRRHCRRNFGDRQSVELVEVIAEAGCDLLFVVWRPLRAARLTLDPISRHGREGVLRGDALRRSLDCLDARQVVSGLGTAASFLGFTTRPRQPLDCRELPQGRRLRLTTMPVAELPHLYPGRRHPKVKASAVREPVGLRLWLGPRDVQCAQKLRDASPFRFTPIAVSVVNLPLPSSLPPFRLDTSELAWTTQHTCAL